MCYVALLGPVVSSWVWRKEEGWVVGIGCACMWSSATASKVIRLQQGQLTSSFSCVSVLSDFLKLKFLDLTILSDFLLQTACFHVPIYVAYYT